MSAYMYFRLGFISRLYFYLSLTTGSQSGGWVPETSRSFHYWQPAPRWRPLPWLANPGNPAMSSHSEGEKTQAPVTVVNSRKKGRDGETASKDSPRSGKTRMFRKTLTKTPTKLLRCPKDQEHKESWRNHAYLTNR